MMYDPFCLPGKAWLHGLSDGNPKDAAATEKGVRNNCAEAALAKQ
jgi:hypothetical protein